MSEAGKPLHQLPEDCVMQCWQTDTLKALEASTNNMARGIREPDQWRRILQTSQSRVFASMQLNAIAIEYLAQTSELIRKSKEAIRKSDEFIRRIKPISH